MRLLSLRNFTEAKEYDVSPIDTGERERERERERGHNTYNVGGRGNPNTFIAIAGCVG